MKRKGNTFDYAQCPQCKIEACGKAQVLELFGTRNCRGYLMIQSWCKKCR